MDNSVNLSGKNILLFAPEGGKGRYGSKILAELQQRGALVSIYPERPSKKTIVKIALRLFKHPLPILFNSYIKKVIKENRSKSFDYVFVVRGEAFNPQSIELLRTAFPQAFFIFYIWDILATNDVRGIIPSFDRVFSFDSEDVKFDKKMIFRPLFYLESHKNIVPDKCKSIDVFFAGTIHSVRYRVLKNVEKYLHQSNRSFYFYYFLPSKFTFIKNIIEGNYPITTNINNFKYSLLSDKEVNECISKSKAMIDIAHPKQHSLSMRTMEALGSNTKLITDCKDIAGYDFYNKNNILIINGENIDFPVSFFELPYVKIPDNIYNRYSLTAWINDVFDHH